MSGMMCLKISGPKGIFWRTKQNHHTLLLDYYYDYFFYIDAQYTSSEVKALIRGYRRESVHD